MLDELLKLLWLMEEMDEMLLTLDKLLWLLLLLDDELLEPLVLLRLDKLL